MSTEAGARDSTINEDPIGMAPESIPDGIPITTPPESHHEDSGSIARSLDADRTGLATSGSDGPANSRGERI